MKKSGLIIYAFLLLTFIFQACNGFDKVTQESEKINFKSGNFEISGELLLPEGDGPFPLVIMVHGDGPAYMTYFSIIKKSFLKAGYATLMWDKLGFGNSTGKFSNEHLQEERAEILIDAIKNMRSHPDIHANKIGVWGISQAGYVIPRALEKTDDISFMILVGVGGENGIQQTAYYIKAQLECIGIPENEALLAAQNFVGLYYAQTYDDYYKCAKPLVDDPMIREMGFVTAMWTEDEWRPHQKTEQAFYNPISVIEKTKVPTLVFFGSLDKNVNPFQGMNAYQTAFEKAGNQNYKVELIEETDHNIIISNTGCETERASRTREGWSNYDPEYLNLMKDWLIKKK